MTFNQIQYLKYLEDLRSHKVAEDQTRARDIETAQHNRAVEQHNVRVLGETVRSNQAREEETRRSNLAREAETFRSNVSHEELNREHYRNQDAVQRDTLSEQIRFNRATQLYRAQQLNLSQQTLNEQQRHSRAIEEETYRANVARESYNERSLVQAGQIAREQMANQIRLANISAAVGHAQVALGYANLAETTRHSQAVELETARSHQSVEAEQRRANQAREAYNQQTLATQRTKNRHDYQYQQQSLDLQRRGQNVQAGTSIVGAVSNAASRLIPFAFMGG